MKETSRIRDQLERAYDGAAWHGPPLKAVLGSVTAQQAAAKPIPGVHSIWELVGHIIAWQRVVVRRLAGERIDDLPADENFPPVNEASEAAWTQTLQELDRSHRELAGAVTRLPDAHLNEVVRGQSYSIYVMLHGVVQHNLYHAGQIAILKKALV
jgi:uncharacterized damage-inducible protein DinB